MGGAHGKEKKFGGTEGGLVSKQTLRDESG